MRTDGNGNVSEVFTTKDGNTILEFSEGIFVLKVQLSGVVIGTLGDVQIEYF